MKKELTSIEIRFLAKELQEIIGAKIDQIYQPTKEGVLLQLHIPSKGKKLLKIILPSFIYLSQEKQEMPKQVSEFVTFLREKISNARIREITQIQNERILEFALEKDQKYSLIIELFSTGNIILCQKEKILMPLSTQKWKNRIIQQGKNYIAPINKYNVFSRESLAKAIANSEDTISKTLAVKLGLGKTYAEELCLQANVDKLNTKISKNEVERIYSEIQRLTSKQIQPRIVYENEEIMNIIPVELKIYSKHRQKEFKTYNDALASVLDRYIDETRKNKAMQKFTRKMEQIETKIQKQKETLAKLEQEAEESQRKGEMIYENYQEIKEKLTGRKRGEKIKIKL